MSDPRAQVARIHVGAADAGYDVVVGRGLSDQVVPMLGENVRRVLLVHAEALAAPAAVVRSGLRDAGYDVVDGLVPDAESAKTADVAARLWGVLGRAGFTRSDAVVTVGGGTVSDLGGFVAATWLRGVAVVHVPTTLLGMVDAAVGGKTGINTVEGKNLVGSFHPPAGVVCDLDALATLPAADLRAGLGEVVKTGFIADERILELIEGDPRAALDPAGDVVAELVTRSVRVKADVVTADLTESSLREILNYGHTFAHAIEQVEKYTWRHGDAVAVGMVFAAELGFRAGHVDAALLARHRSVLKLVGLPTSYEPGRWDDLLAAMRRDKKTRGDLLRFVVLDAVGAPVRLAGPTDAWLQESYAAVSSA